MWNHICPVDQDVISLEKEELCSWCLACAPGTEDKHLLEHKFLEQARPASNAQRPGRPAARRPA